MKRLFVILSFAASAIIFNSCGPSRNTVEVQPVAPAYEHPVSPGPEYVWVDGDWAWHGDRYIYTNGYWVRPEPRHVWVAGEWVHNNKGYYWKKGHWEK